MNASGQPLPSTPARRRPNIGWGAWRDGRGGPGRPKVWRPRDTWQMSSCAELALTGIIAHHIARVAATRRPQNWGTALRAQGMHRALDGAPCTSHQARLAASGAESAPRARVVKSPAATRSRMGSSVRRAPTRGKPTVPTVSARAEGGASARPQQSWTHLVARHHERPPAAERVAAAARARLAPAAAEQSEGPANPRSRSSSPGPEQACPRQGHRAQASDAHFLRGGRCNLQQLPLPTVGWS